MVQVGEEVLVKARVVAIQEKKEGVYYVDLEYPDWFTPGRTRQINVTTDQKLLVRIKKQA